METKHTVKTIEELITYYKHDRFEGRGKDYEKCIIEAHKERLAKKQYTMITHHDSKTGANVYLYA